MMCSNPPTLSLSASQGSNIASTYTQAPIGDTEHTVIEDVDAPSDGAQPLPNFVEDGAAFATTPVPVPVVANVQATPGVSVGGVNDIVPTPALTRNDGSTSGPAVSGIGNGGVQSAVAGPSTASIGTIRIPGTGKGKKREREGDHGHGGRNTRNKGKSKLVLDVDGA
jgi:hypothetical protein